MMTDTLSLMQFHDDSPLLINALLSDRIPVIIEPYPGSNKDVIQKKFLVPKDISIEIFMEEVSQYIHERYTLINFYVQDNNPFSCLFPWCCSIEYTPISPRTSMNDLYNESKNGDDILYLRYRLMI